jgi:uncharacterized protein (DUF2336 family)
MIIREFLTRTQNASASHRAEAATVLARTYLYGGLTADEAWEAKTALLTLLDDPSPVVRCALAETGERAPWSSHCPATCPRSRGSCWRARRY